MAKTIAFFDIECGIDSKKIYDIGAVKNRNDIFHKSSVGDFAKFIANCEYICGHNIIQHDIKYLNYSLGYSLAHKKIDTLYLSPLLFPKRPYHALLKNDKIQSDEFNNPVNDAKKAEVLFYDEINAFQILPDEIKEIYYVLLHKQAEFKDFFAYIGYKCDTDNVAYKIQSYFSGRICPNAPVEDFVINNPVELAYALALINTGDSSSITPPWLLNNYHGIENIIRLLCNTLCREKCSYCSNFLDVKKALKKYFDFDNFRTYNGEPLQEMAAQAAVEGESLLAIFPTGGGKSLTFQIPALMAGNNARGLTVVISPLLSLMKDQVDNLNNRGITEAVTVNGLLNIIERANVLERIANGSAKILYISPEQLRSKTIERLLLNRNVVRFVIDEAHCFSAWGHDFRVDYLYIGDFIREFQKKKNIAAIPVSCFTATAKQKVITDIFDYFQKKLNLNMKLFATTAVRENLRYKVMFKENDEDKYNTLRDLIRQKQCPTIVYVSRTRRTVEIAEKLSRDGFAARPFNGKMDAEDKIKNQEAFINNEIQVIVATSAFGMGVDKKDIKLVVHYDISSSLEDYVQEAGRAGRDPQLQADCFVLYNNNDLDKHFILLNQTKLSIAEIQQVWKAIKDLTKQRNKVCCSPLEIARQAGWDDTVIDIETRVKTAIAALESAGYIKRGRNMPQIFATGILVPDMRSAAAKLEQSKLFNDNQIETAKRIIKFLISRKSIAKAGNDDAESRVDYIADRLGIAREEVVNIVNLMRQDGLLADSKDMTAYIFETDKLNRSKLLLERFIRLEKFFLSQIKEEGCYFNFKELNEEAQQQGITTATVKNLKTLLYYYVIKGYLKKDELICDGKIISKFYPNLKIETLEEKYDTKIEICEFILRHLFDLAEQQQEKSRSERYVEFSVVGTYNAYKHFTETSLYQKNVSLGDIEDGLLYLSKIGAVRLEGGFLVLYNAMEIERLVQDNRIKYKLEDYRFLNEFYKQKIQQIHIVGEYANLMTQSYQKALEFVQDYFQMDYKKFISKYFKGEREKEINRNITPAKYEQLFSLLSPTQSEIINDNSSKYMVVAAGPGSGKTRVLVHKLASLIILEDVKYEQLLMVTFSRAAATEFKQRLIELIGNAANFVDIKTFHSYCFDLLGKFGSLENVDNVIRNATEMIKNGEVEVGKITKSVLVIDEAQDMDADDFELIKALMAANEEMRVIAVGDDDQNIYEFRGSDSKYLRALIDDYGAKKYEMVENYRSKRSIVTLANDFVKSIHNRMKNSFVEAVTEDIGKVRIVHHYGKNMEEAIANDIVMNKTQSSTCVLTNTNEEALKVLSFLLRKKVNAKLVQSLDGFKLNTLLEIRYLLRQIDHDLKTPVIPDYLWEKAKNNLCRYYADSKCLENCKNLLETFEEIYPVKYRSDFGEFINESNYEDFYSNEQDTVFISTIHKAKGREFDRVYMLLDNCKADSDEERRKLYVGMTRAKSELIIHCNNALLDAYSGAGVECIKDYTEYSNPKEIILQLGHRDVFLSCFKDKKEIIGRLRSGQILIFKNNYLYIHHNGSLKSVAKLSKRAADNIGKLNEKGYRVFSAEIRFIVSWKEKDDTEECAVILPTLYLQRAR